jgi:hypothetical protein
MHAEEGIFSATSIVNTGKARGAHPEDIYGCLYFFLSEQLRAFAGRLRKFSSSFTILTLDARELPRRIRENEFSEFNIPSSIKFDRIEVSNIVDTDYVGLDDVLTLWGPYLKKNRSAAIVGYFMNWVELQKDGRSSGRSVQESLLLKVFNKEEVSSNLALLTEAE